MRESFRKVPTSKAPGDFDIPWEACKLLQSQDVMKQMFLAFLLRTLMR
jgi:hypothetical protein